MAASDFSSENLGVYDYTNSCPVSLLRFRAASRTYGFADVQRNNNSCGLNRGRRIFYGFAQFSVNVHVAILAVDGHRYMRPFLNGERVRYDDVVATLDAFSLSSNIFILKWLLLSLNIV
jgi:hypothetical protein